MRKVALVFILIMALASCECSHHHHHHYTTPPPDPYLITLYNAKVYNNTGKVVCSGVNIVHNGEPKILTANHCVDDRESVVVAYDQNRYSTRVGKRDKKKDLALLRYNLSRYVLASADLSPNSVTLDEAVWACGNPAGVRDVLSRGRVAKLSHVGLLGRSRTLVSLTAVWGGMSGGGLYNRTGRLVGIMVQYMPATGLAAAVKLRDIKEFLR